MKSGMGTAMRPITAVTVAALAAAAVAACGSNASNGTDLSGSSGGGGSSSSSSSSSGVTRILTGSALGSPDQDIAVTVVKVVLSPSSSEDGFGPEPGDQWVAVEISIKNLASAPYTDDPNNCLTAVDVAGQSITADEDAPTSVGPQFSDQLALTQGSSTVGVITFDVANGDKIKTLLFTPEQGTGTDVGTWALG
jgi:Domain of unknown function (DUF4352)